MKRCEFKLGGILLFILVCDNIVFSIHEPFTFLMTDKSSHTSLLGNSLPPRLDSLQNGMETPIISKAGQKVVPRIYGSWVIYLDSSNNLYAYNLNTHEDRKIASTSVAWSWAEIYDRKVVWSDDRTDPDGDIYMYDLDLGRERVICSKHGSQLNPYIYADKIVWQDDRNGNLDVYMYDITTGVEQAIGSDPLDEKYPCIYGNKIAWWTKSPEQSFGGYRLTLYDIGTRQKQQVNVLVFMSLPMDIYENRIVYQDMSRTSASGYEDVFMYDMNTNAEVPICNKEGGQFRPRIFGNRIVWQDTRNSDGIDRADVYMYDLSTNQENRITTASVTNRGGSPSPDIYMNKIVWSDDRNGQCDIYMLELTGSSNAFDPTRDSFNFINEGFGQWGLNENVMSMLDVTNFIINEPVYRLVDAAIPGSSIVLIPLVYTYLKSYHQKLLNGHCYGMSYLVARWFNHPEERPGYPDATVQSLQINDELHRRIDYAQQSQLLDFYTFVRSFFAAQDSFSWSNLKEYETIKDLVQSGNPTVMGIMDKKNNLYHAVVVYRIITTGTTDMLFVSDPNKQTVTYSFDTSKDDLGIGFRIMALGITDQELFDRFLEWLGNSLTFWVHCPVQMQINDSAGNRVGINAMGAQEIGFKAAIFQTDDSQLAVIPNPLGNYSVKLVGTGTGTYNLTTYLVSENEIQSSTATGSIVSGQTMIFSAIISRNKLVFQVLTIGAEGLFGISWLTWPILLGISTIWAGLVIVLTIIIRKRKSKVKNFG